MFNWLGIQSSSPLSEKLVSTIGGCVALISVSAITYFFIGEQNTLVVTSMGAATVLLFAIPHAPFSQPWALFAGNTLSALIGVCCAKWIPDIYIASGIAVGGAIGTMLIFRCIHPPGGATALAAVIGGEPISQLGFWFILTPVLINCIIIFSTALVFNNIFPWRRYPSSLMRYKPTSATEQKFKLDEKHIELGLREMGIIVDISPRQLQQIFQSAQKHRDSEIAGNFNLELGGVYTNNRPGADWAIRKIIDHASHPDPTKELIIYKVLDGAQKHSTGSCSRNEFAEWANQKLNSAK